MAAKIRLDLYLIELGLVEDRSLAQRLIMAGQVRVNKQVQFAPATIIPRDAVVEIEQGPCFVSRGGEKLEAALQAFSIQVKGKICADVGASTGGFTDCLLQYGAKRVYAIDVGEGILEWRLRQHTQVVVMEGINARYVTSLPEPIDLVTIDASFISLKILLPVVKNWFAACERKDIGQVIALIKPQFESTRTQAARERGVIRDPEVHRQVLLKVLSFADAEGFEILGLLRSPLLGPKGNTEFLVQMAFPGKKDGKIDNLVSSVILPL